MNILTDPVTAGLESALDLRTRQHALTASNVANADTPEEPVADGWPSCMCGQCYN